MHESTNKGQSQSYVSVIRPDKRSALNDDKQPEKEDKKNNKDHSEINNKKSSINIKVVLMI